MRITIRDKEASSVQEMFLDRVRLHNKGELKCFDSADRPELVPGYQHRTIKIVDRMLLDALLAADTHGTSLGSYKCAVFLTVPHCMQCRF